MNEIVFLSPNTKEPFTTSDIIAEKTNNNYRSVQRIIETQRKRLEKFGIMRFQITLNGRRGRPKKIYQLNEQQATLLITFMKNNDIVADFKTELVRQFYSMRNELMNVRLAKASRKEIRLNMTDSIKALPDSPHKNFKYSQYTNLAYLFVTGKTAKTIRQERGAKKNAAASDYMTAEEILKIADAENRISVLIDAGFDYGQIKSALYMSRVAIA
jgi:phage regulator Rha-like protein